MKSLLNRRLFTVALVWLTLTAVSSTAQIEAAASPKVVFVIVDGIPADVIERVPTPTIDAITAGGGYSRATVGGPIGEPGETPTISAPGYMSLITGTWANKHNVYKNYGISPDYRYWNLFRLARSEKPELQLAIFSTWTDNRTILLGEGLAEAGNWRFDVVVDGLEEDAARFPPRPLDAHIADIDDAVSRDAARGIESEGLGDPSRHEDAGHLEPLGLGRPLEALGERGNDGGSRRGSVRPAREKVEQSGRLLRADAARIAKRDQGVFALFERLAPTV